MRFIDRWRSITTVRLERGRCRCLKGKLPQTCLTDLAAALTGDGVDDAEIYVAGDGRLTFSPEVPPRLHQPLRNIMLGYHNPS